MEPKINESIFECIGNTPLVRLQRIPQSEGIECQILVKCEFMNPGGSVKDRIGREMFVAAEKEGRIHKGDTIIEATSGNAGIGLAFVAACKGYKMVITLPEKMSNEKVAVLKSLGAEIIRTPTEAHTFDEDSHYMVARKINKQLENSHILDQYANPNNPLVSSESNIIGSLQWNWAGDFRSNRWKGHPHFYRSWNRRNDNWSNKKAKGAKS